jgi:hypothetical protein
MKQLTHEVRGATRRLSADQMLELADVLHDAIRERREEERSWRPSSRTFGRRN